MWSRKETLKYALSCQAVDTDFPNTKVCHARVAEPHLPQVFTQGRQSVRIDASEVYELVVFAASVINLVTVCDSRGVFLVPGNGHKVHQS